MGRHSRSEPDATEAARCGMCGSTEHTDTWHDDYWGEGDDL
jgi:hypothetical protein